MARVGGLAWRAPGCGGSGCRCLQGNWSCGTGPERRGEQGTREEEAALPGPTGLQVTLWLPRSPWLPSGTALPAPHAVFLVQLPPLSERLSFQSAYFVLLRSTHFWPK